ncbi:TniB family NTP-binding protein [Delftia tsuruhatensis]|uniref:TniB family NTP-binding protein n=1 Tax=Delftia tsuruhatensis TaxID=180282 RepID=UPI0020915604|nr:TniB family NTP-binding protein [Delftia tsuruhatensis]MCO5337582.1 TniB family NTP-binding protein [Delftia tsuruhatensis]MCR4548253.1 TniB family NTP-binding protein [Delftia tsuruhatensis]
MHSSIDHPELSVGPNPFFRAVSPFISQRDMALKLRNSPLKNVLWKEIRPHIREPLLNLYTSHFIPTARLLEPALAIQNLVRRSLSLQNPEKTDEKKRVNQIAMAESYTTVINFKPLEGGGMLLSGMTGMGKSALLRRTLEVIAPSQIVDYKNSETLGFYSLRQCVYLIVDHPSNGSRRGLLLSILQGLDEQLGTDYHKEHLKTANLDSLLCITSKLLVRHRVALLCIDEKQDSTFEESPWRREFSQFYLRLMNLGISVVLCGNPLAFEHIYSYSQLIRRFSMGGIFELQPAQLGCDAWWMRDFISEARKFSIVENWQIDDAYRRKMEDECSGGVPSFYMSLHVEVQRIALRRSSGPEATVTESDYVSAQSSARVKYIKSVSQASKLENTTARSNFLDIPSLRTRVKDKFGESNSISHDLLPPQQGIIAAEKLVKQYKTKQTKNANRMLEELKSLKNMSPEDVRLLGVKTDLLLELEKQMEAKE